MTTFRAGQSNCASGESQISWYWSGRTTTSRSDEPKRRSSVAIFPIPSGVLAVGSRRTRAAEMNTKRPTPGGRCGSDQITVPDDVDGAEIGVLLAGKRAGDHRHRGHDGVNANNGAPERLSIAK